MPNNPNLRAIPKITRLSAFAGGSISRSKRDVVHGMGRTHSGDNDDTEAIRALNDELRQNLSAGTALITAGVAALGAEAVARIVKTIAVYDDFCHANDPYEEHDFGVFEIDGHKLFFKIDYYDKSRSYHSPDPADPSVTERVITIMLAEEY
jgi:Protein of unknown function (DUF3768)